MTGDLRLVIFDVDGTLVDSQGEIWSSMQEAYAAVGVTPPARGAVLGIVGLSLHAAFRELSPDLTDAQRAELERVYKTAYVSARARKGPEASPLYPGAREALEALHAHPETLLAVATGKSRRGLDALMDGHRLQPFFLSCQTADDHPSKPHPSMIEACLRETGVDAARAVMVGDTRFDMEMAAAARVGRIAVSWGYHRVDQMAADAVIDRFSDLPGTVDRLLEVNA